MLLRMNDMAERDKQVDEEKQAVREIAIRQRRIASDLVFIAQNKQMEDTRNLQDFLRLQTEIERAEKKLIGVDAWL